MFKIFLLGNFVPNYILAGRVSSDLHCVKLDVLLISLYTFHMNMKVLN